MSQGIALLQDLKLGQYVKVSDSSPLSRPPSLLAALLTMLPYPPQIPPRVTFLMQISAACSFLARLVASLCC